MRGVKIGTKRGGGAQFGMSVFEMKDKKTPEQIKKAGEEVVKNMSDESLGLSSDA